MDAESSYLTTLIALNVALLLILAGLAKKQLEWRRPAPLTLERRRSADDRQPHRAAAPLARWVAVGLVVSLWIAAALANG
jgi:hypothetical protein